VGCSDPTDPIAAVVAHDRGDDPDAQDGWEREVIRDVAMFDTLSRETLQPKLSCRSVVPPHPCPALSWGAMAQDDSDWNFAHYTDRRQ
jgi:hypothetical protein